jgi:hypothetical protein
MLNVKFIEDDPNFCDIRNTLLGILEGGIILTSVLMVVLSIVFPA